MRRAALTVLALLASAPVQAEPLCTLLADAADGTILHQSGDGCARPVPPASTFKIAIALMAADSGVIADAQHPLWPFQPGYPDFLPVWRQDTTPTAWIAHSVIWYSQQITQRLGAERFAAYVRAFEYGNRDVAGDPGKDNGLTRAWLSSSLEITPSQQAAFLRKLVRRQLPVSDHAFALTEKLTAMEGGPAGWKLHGKTGSGAPPKAGGDGRDWDHAYGWFVGWLRQADRTLVFVRLNQDDGPRTVSAGFRARDEILALLPNLLPKAAP